MNKIKTAESVSPRHPDKLCDRISDAILDACLEQDPDSRVAIETMGGHGIITITGEITTTAYFNAREIAQRIAGTQYGVQVNIVNQSPEIAIGVDEGGAGDQGIMVGYACNDNEAMIPQEQYLARSLCEFIYPEYQYDGKTQITLNENNEITTIVASFQNTRGVELMSRVEEWLQEKGIEDNEIKIKIHVNPAGDWDQGGFEADTGVTGRKLIVDNYGPQVPIGGGAFSGKDPSKVDRSGAYMARKIAKDYLKEYKGKECIVKLAYAIGIAEPVMAVANVDGQEYNILGRADGKYDLTPNGIIKSLNLKKVNYEATAMWGHFGWDFNWDK